MKAFLVSVGVVALVEIGDKTQLLALMLAAQFRSLMLVVVRTTIGMLLAKVPAVFAGQALMRRVPLNAVRIVSALTFLALGVYALVS